MRFLMPFARQASFILSERSASSRSGRIFTSSGSRSRARLARPDVDAALLGLAALPDEVAAVVATRRTPRQPEGCEVFLLGLLAHHGFIVDLAGEVEIMLPRVAGLGEVSRRAQRHELPMVECLP